MTLFDPEKVSAFNGPQSAPARRSLEMSNTMGQQQQQQEPYRRTTNNNTATAVTTTRHGRNKSVPDRISAFYRRYRENNNNVCTNSSQTSSSYYSSLTSSSSSRSDIIEMLFARIVDALIFTSAIAITAYNYWIGALDNNNTAQSTLTSGQHHQHHHHHQQQPILDIRQWRQTYAPKFNRDDDMKQHDFLEDSKRQRTQQWAETMAKQTPSPTHSSSRAAQKSKIVQFPNQEIPTKSAIADPMTQREAAPSQSSNKQNKKRRTQSLPPPKRDSNAQVAQEKQDEMLTRMEERLQNLIEEGQAALTSKVELYELDEKEVAMRKAFSQRKKHSV